MHERALAAAKQGWAFTWEEFRWAADCARRAAGGHAGPLPPAHIPPTHPSHTISSPNPPACPVQTAQEPNVQRAVRGERLLREGEPGPLRLRCGRPPPRPPAPPPPAPSAPPPPPSAPSARPAFLPRSAHRRLHGDGRRPARQGPLRRPLRRRLPRPEGLLHPAAPERPEAVRHVPRGGPVQPLGRRRVGPRV